ncbi:MAG: alginate lyase family protein, partial [Chitinophagaceae bacterium]
TKTNPLRLLTTICLLLLAACTRAQHPLTFFTKAEASAVKASLAKYPLLQQSYNDIKKDVDEWVGKTVDVPVPKDPAGGYTHDRHRSNYMLMFNSGVLFNITGDVKYAKLVKDILLKYAVLNPTLKKHPQATSSSPGHIFWQALNDANWLVYTGMAYDLTRNAFSAAERKTIEDGAFKPEVDYITKDLQTWFDLIHNHGVWACAGVGLVGIATDNKEYVDMALYGTAKTGKSGFIAQMNNLYSPDGYYTEGPYYARYAILPYYIFANALQHARPELKIFQQRDRILQKALMATLQQTNLDGKFFPLNDAIKDKDFTTNELVTAISIAWNVYGEDKGLLAVAKKQQRVLLNKGGASLAAAIATGKNIPAYYSYRSVQYKDGVKGDEGGLSLLRNGKGNDLTTLIYKYTAHGLSHGHFDKLHIGLFDRGNEILTDYGSVRFVNVEQKYGGRYLPENDAYAAQTIAHNTVVVDESSHFNGNEKLSEQHHPELLFSSIADSSTMAVSARTKDAYKNVQLHRTVYLLQLDNKKKIAVDVFRVLSPNAHQFDLPFHYNGQIISTSAAYKANKEKLEPLGSKNGYQFLWKEAEAVGAKELSQLTFLNGSSYYTISSLTDDSTRIFFTRTGANDPNFNLRREPSWILRKNGKGCVFVNVVEMHGRYDAAMESSSGSRPEVSQIRVLQNDEEYTIVRIDIAGKPRYIMQCNSDFNPDAKHKYSGNDIELSWTGPFIAVFDDIKYQQTRGGQKNN